MNRPTEPAEDVVSPAQPSDAAIIVRSRDEPESFALLFRRHAAALQRYIARRIGPTVAEDVLADVFLAAFRQRHRYDPDRADARPWLYGIATNLVGRHRRAEVRALRNLERTGMDPVTEAFVERSDARVGAAAVRQRLAAGPAPPRPGDRSALLPVSWGQRTHDGRAAALDIPVGTVRSRVNPARSSMRTALRRVDPAL